MEQDCMATDFALSFMFAFLVTMVSGIGRQAGSALQLCSALGSSSALSLRSAAGSGVSGISGISTVFG